MNKKMIFILVVLSWFGFNFAARAENGPAVLSIQSANAKEIDSPKIETVIEQKNESEIPVILDTKKAESSEANPISRMFLGFAIIGGLLMATWMAVRRYQFKNKGLAAATQMKVLTQHHLGPKKSLAVVQVAGESILIGVTDHHISMIKSLSLLDDEIPAAEPVASFSQVLNRDHAEENEDFAISGIKDFVTSRLKNMRSIE